MSDKAPDMESDGTGGEAAAPSTPAPETRAPMKLFGPLTRNAFVLLLVMLGFQMVLLAMTLSEDTKGLGWLVREDDCDFGVLGFSQTAVMNYEFFTTRFCFEQSSTVSARSCAEYETLVRDSLTEQGSADAKKMQDEFAAAGGLAATLLTFTILLIALVVAKLVFADKAAVIPICAKDSKVFSLVFSAVTTLMIIFAFAAAIVAGESTVGKAWLIVGCDQNGGYTRGGYGVGILVFLVLWMLAEIAIVVIPQGPLVRASSSYSPPTAVKISEVVAVETAEASKEDV